VIHPKPDGSVSTVWPEYTHISPTSCRGSHVCVWHQQPTHQPRPHHAHIKKWTPSSNNATNEAMSGLTNSQFHYYAYYCCIQRTKEIEQRKNELVWYGTTIVRYCSLHQVNLSAPVTGMRNDASRKRDNRFAPWLMDWWMDFHLIKW